MIDSRSRHDLKLELFPFISLFLCVIGVLAFLQNLMVMGDIGATEEASAKQAQIFQTPYRMDVYPGSVVLHPPASDLHERLPDLALDERAALERIERGRSTIHETDGFQLDLTIESNQAVLATLLNETVTVNRLAESRGFPYEEYLLLVIHPASTDTYHYLRGLMDQADYRYLRIGLDVGDGAAFE